MDGASYRHAVTYELINPDGSVTFEMQAEYDSTWNHTHNASIICYLCGSLWGTRRVYSIRHGDPESAILERQFVGVLAACCECGDGSIIQPGVWHHRHMLDYLPGPDLLARELDLALINAQRPTSTIPPAKDWRNNVR